MPSFETEREGQISFYERFLPRVDPSLTLDDILADDNDGVLNGNLLEFKLRVSDLNAALFQCIKYLSALRIKGKPVPANIVIVDLNGELAYHYKSGDYLPDIEKVYSGGASKSNTGFDGRPYVTKYAYGADQLDAVRLIEQLKETEYTRIHIDENCIVGWATTFYRTVPTARKEDFIGDDTGLHRKMGEIRRPSTFEKYIYPYKGETNVRFQYLMDKLNDTLQKKNLGAFYTPKPYAEKSHELLRMAIERVPEGNDYVIIDRCAGTGNLERGLTDEELSHCILSTVEYYEYKVLQEVLGAKVRRIIPPIETEDTFNAGLVKGSDALSRDFIENPIIREFLDNPRCTVILFENPPYAETTSGEHQRTGQSKKSSVWKRSYVSEQMKLDLKGKPIMGRPRNDLGNAFIWSGFKYYLRQPTDSYVVFSPIKYWKAQHLVHKRFIKGFAFNRKWFHTRTDACVTCILWANTDSDITELELEGFDMAGEDGPLLEPVTLTARQIQSNVSARYYDKRPIPDEWRGGVLCGLNGLENATGKPTNKPVYNKNVLGYMVSHSSGFDNPDFDSSLLVAGRYDGHGFWLRKDNYLEKLPLFCMSRYYKYNKQWTQRAFVMKSGDGADRFNADVADGKLNQWLLKCLLFTCVEVQNHMRTFTGSDGRLYRNELCLDTTNGSTVAYEDLKALSYNEAEQRIVDQWNILLAAAKQTSEYDSSLTYGIYQIHAEIDTFYKDEDDKKAYNNIEVHSALETLKQLVKEYYNDEIVPTLFEYELLK